VASERLLTAGRRTVAVISVDVNGFKSVNDRLGHAAGDEVLTLLPGSVQVRRSATRRQANGVLIERHKLTPSRRSKPWLRCR
jgi:GGDEF domain-containing protein